MALIVGDLTSDPDAQSFISVDDADAYLRPERIAAWEGADEQDKEAALVRASRWLVATFRFHPITDARLAQVGRVAARLAAETLDKPLFEGTDTTSIVQSERVDVISVTYAASHTRADAAGMAWPWLHSMLHGLVMSGSTVPVVRV